MSHHLRLAATTVLILLPALAAAGPIDLDAFVIAQQHFDPEHEVGIEFDDPEVAFAQQALQAAREAVPEVAGIPVRRESRNHDRFMPDAHFTVELKAPGGFRDEGRADRLRTVAEAVGEDCALVERTTVSWAGGRRGGEGTEAMWTLDGACVHENDTRYCAREAVADWLCRQGVDRMILTRRKTNGRDSARLFLVFRSPIDDEYVAGHLVDEPLYATIFGDLTAHPYHRLLVGDGPEVKVHDEAGPEGFDGITFRFSVGWGDCEAGCIHSHYWLVTCTAGERSADGTWDFAAALVEEGGSPLSEAKRAQMRKAARR